MKGEVTAGYPEDFNPPIPTPGAAHPVEQHAGIIMYEIENEIEKKCQHENLITMCVDCGAVIGDNETEYTTSTSAQDNKTEYIER